MVHEQILEILENKNIILVGNSIEIMNYEKGEFIDSHDVVIRMGKGIPRWDRDIHIGKKIDTTQIKNSTKTIKSYTN